MKRKVKMFLFLVLVFLFFAKGVSAYIGDPQTFEDSTIGIDSYNSESSALKTATDLISSFNLLLLGPTKEKYIDKFSQKMGGGAIASVGNLIAGMYSNPPASSVTYFADVLHNLGIAKPAYAQGVGFSGMSNLLPLWKASRNLAYIFFIIAFMYIGLAIMFRVKISPQAVITIQNALPKLIIGLVLVTFSYAIVGLMIDLIYVLIYVGILAIGQTGWIEVAKEQAKYSSLSFGEGVLQVFGGGLKSLYNFWGEILGASALVLVLSFITPLSAWFSLGPVALLTLVLAVVSLFLIFKLFFSLLMCYAGIIISLIVGPLQIMLGVLPGSQGGFGGWFKNLMANILVFPAVALAMLIGWLLTGSHGPTWAPPVISPSGGRISPLIGFAILLLLPKIPDIVKNAFKIKPTGYGQAIGEMVGAPKRLVGQGIGLVTTTSGIARAGRELGGEGFWKGVRGRLQPNRGGQIENLSK